MRGEMGLCVQVLGLQLPFDEAALLKENSAYIQRKLGLESLSIHEATREAAEAKQVPRILDARPGSPIAVFSS